MILFLYSNYNLNSLSYLILENSKTSYFKFDVLQRISKASREKPANHLL